jgi:hypothetical protein
MGIDRILFSVDYPFAENPPGTEWPKTLPLGPEDTEKLLKGNAPPPAQALNGADARSKVFVPTPSPIKQAGSVLPTATPSCAHSDRCRTPTQRSWVQKSGCSRSRATVGGFGPDTIAGEPAGGSVVNRLTE